MSKPQPWDAATFEALVRRDNAQRAKEQAHAAALAAAQAAVVKAAEAVDAQYASLIRHGRASKEMCALHAACADLKKLGG